ncbi:MAG: hypothetical protein ACYCZF_16660 [Anaerolineae bacterium]
MSSPPTSDARRIRWDTLPAVWALVVVAGVFLFVTKGIVAPNDFWWHLRAGQVIIQQRAIPTTDLFSFTRLGQPWVYQSWLIEILFYLLYQAGGIPLLLLLNALAITATYAVVLNTSFGCTDGNMRLAALVTLGAIALALTNTMLRPQVITYPLLAWTLWCVNREERDHTRSGALWSLPLLYVLWANSHGGFVFGLALLAASTAGRLLEWLRKREPFPTRLFIVSLLCAAAVLVTPMGVGVVNYVLGFARHPVTSQMNQEFLPPNIRDLTGQLFFGLLGLFVVLLIISGYRPRATEALRLLVFAALAISAVRCVAWFGVIAAPVLAAALTHWARERGKVYIPKTGFRLINRILVFLMLSLCVLSLPWLRPYIQIPGASTSFVTPETPEQATAYLCAQSQQRPLKVYHTEGAGSYLIWACPSIPVFIDTRIELYPPEQWRDHIDIGHALYNWEELLAKYQVNALLLQVELHAELIAAVTASPHWQRTYEDKLFVIFEQRGGM